MGKIKELSVVIPAFNEAMRIGATLRRVSEYCGSRFDRFEIIVVDDGSTDETAKEAKNAIHDERLRVIVLEKNRGKGYAVRTGGLHAKFEYVLFSDADLSTPIEEVENLEKYASPRSLVIASRGLQQSRLEVRQPFYRETMGRIFNLIVRLLLVPDIADTQCGFKLFGREVVKEIFPRTTIDRFAFDVEIIYLARKLGFDVVEVPVRWRNDSRSRVHPIRDSMQMLADVGKVFARERILSPLKGGKDRGFPAGRE
jgi:dolichyl-phosphate beta-glucosyltransferase